MEDAWFRAEVCTERYAKARFVPPYGANGVATAKQHFHNAALNWRLALQFEKAEAAEARGKGAAEEMEAARMRKDKEAKAAQILADEEARQKEFVRQWNINAERVRSAHPELRHESSLYSQAMRKVLNSNPVYLQRVDGFELAYKVIKKQLPPPGNAMPLTEFYRLIEDLKTDPPPPQ